MSQIHFTKMSGSGNDFLLIDNRAGQVRTEDARQLAIRACRHRLSVGADGIVLLSDADKTDIGCSYRWRYINADGSDGEMCGNGAMCAARFAVRDGIAAPHHRFRTEAGVVEAWVDTDSPAVSILVADPDPVQAPVVVEVRGQTLSCVRIVVGVPHVVIEASDADRFADADEFARIGRSIRRHPAFAPDGTNVNVISRIDENIWRMRTYERGVEAETLACGTGAVASAIVLGFSSKAVSPTTIRTSSGKNLLVAYDRNGASATNVRLTGQASFIYDGQLLPDALSD